MPWTVDANRQIGWEQICFPIDEDTQLRGRIILVHWAFRQYPLIGKTRPQEQFAVKKVIAAVDIAAVAMPSSPALAAPPPCAPARGKRAKDRGRSDGNGRASDPRR